MSLRSPVTMAVLWAFLCLGWRESFASFSSVSEIQIEGLASDNFADAQFRLWTQDAPSRPSFILCFISGDGMSALGISDDRTWQQLASRLNACLLTVHFRDSRTGTPWHAADAGSGRALTEALQGLSTKTKKDSLEKLPLALVGLSTGGQYAYHWACWRPEQTLCFITLKGGYHDEGLHPEILGIPALWATADKDMPFRQKNIRAVVEKHKAAGAPWILAVEPNAGHPAENTSRLIAPYLEAVVSKTWNDFDGLLRDFQAGRKIGNWPELPLNSPPLPEYAIPSSYTLDFAPCVSGKISSSVEIQFSAKEASLSWDRVEAVDPGNMWDFEKKSGPDSPNGFRLRLKPPLASLGLFKTMARFRFYQGERLLLGGLNIPAQIWIEGDVEISPKSLYLGVLKGAETSSKTLTVKSRNNHPVAWDPDKSTIPSFVKMEAVAGTDGPLKLRFHLTPSDSSREASQKGFELLLAFRTDKDWLVRVPVIFAVQSP